MRKGSIHQGLKHVLFNFCSIVEHTNTRFFWGEALYQSLDIQADTSSGTVLDGIPFGGSDTEPQEVCLDV